jgi:hypothetical protein
MTKFEIMRFDGSWTEAVRVEDGVPVSYGSLAPPPPKSEEPTLAARIEKLTGKRVRFDTWVEIHGDPRDGAADVKLLPALADGFHPLPDRFGELVVILDGRPIKFTCLGPTRDDTDVATLERIAALTCFRVRFGAWRDTPQSERDGGAEADLIVLE